MQSGDPSANLRAIQSGRSYTALLRQHIIKEDNILFPMANQVIPFEQHAQVWESFERAVFTENSEGVHEKFTALAKALEQEIAA
jgi:hemerythrin-like domain-containing protein